MKRRIILSIALVLSIIWVSPMSSDSTAKAQPNCSFKADTGFVATGDGKILGQLLRITAVYDYPGEYAQKIFVRFRQIEYAKENCQEGACKQTVVSDTTTTPIQLVPGAAVSFDTVPRTTNSSGVRGIILIGTEDLQKSQNLKANAQLIDQSSQKVVALLGLHVDTSPIDLN
ncbi:MAG: hypothetical protein M3209_01155 [Acidobacteriota bacterium]|nr:hypothetical protein [Acidobacteriota bacterium]